jgi:hypothetical protein
MVNDHQVHGRRQGGDKNIATKRETARLSLKSYSPSIKAR